MTRIVLICGVIYALISALISVLYFNQTFGMLAMTGLGIVVLILTLIVGIMMYRKGNNGFSPFKDNLKLSAGIVLIGVVLSGILGQVYNNSLSDEAKSEFQDSFIDNQLAGYESLGLPITSEVEENLENQAKAMFSFKLILMGLPFALMMYGLVAFIVALIFRKDPIEQQGAV